MTDVTPPTAALSPMPAALRTAVQRAAREMNRGRYFEAHEELEEVLDEVPDELWNLFLGLIQVAVGYHKVSQGLQDGAAAMFAKALDKLQPYAADAGAVHVAAIRQRVAADLAALRSGRFDHHRFANDPPRLQPLRV